MPSKRKTPPADVIDAIWEAMFGNTNLSSVLMSFDEVAQTVILRTFQVTDCDYSEKGMRSFGLEDASCVVPIEHLAKFAWLDGSYDDEEEDVGNQPVFAASDFCAPPALTHAALDRTSYVSTSINEDGTWIETTGGREPLTHILDCLGQNQWVDTDRGLVPQREPSTRARKVVILHWCLEILRCHLGIAEQFNAMFDNFIGNHGDQLNRRAAGIAADIGQRNTETMSRLPDQIAAVQRMIEVLQSQGPEWPGSGWTKLVGHLPERARRGTTSLDYLVTTGWALCLGEVDPFAEAKRTMTFKASHVEMWPTEFSSRKGIESAICALYCSQSVKFSSSLRRSMDESSEPLTFPFLPDAMQPWRTLRGRRRNEIVDRMMAVLFNEVRRDEAERKAERS